MAEGQGPVGCKLVGQADFFCVMQRGRLGRVQSCWPPSAGHGIRCNICMRVLGTVGMSLCNCGASVLLGNVQVACKNVPVNVLGTR